MGSHFSISLFEEDVIAGFSLDDIYGLHVTMKPHIITEFFIFYKSLRTIKNILSKENACVALSPCHKEEMVQENGQVYHKSQIKVSENYEEFLNPSHEQITLSPLSHCDTHIQRVLVAFKMNRYIAENKP